MLLKEWPKSSVELFRFVLINNFSISLWEKTKAPHVHGFRIFGRVHSSQNQLVSTLETQGYLKSFKKIQNRFRNKLCWRISRSWTPTFWFCWKRWDPTKAWRPVLNKSWKSVIRDQYLPKNMKWEFVWKSWRWHQLLQENMNWESWIWDQ